MYQSYYGPATAIDSLQSNYRQFQHIKKFKRNNRMIDLLVLAILVILHGMITTNHKSRFISKCKNQSTRFSNEANKLNMEFIRRVPKKLIQNSAIEFDNLNLMNQKIPDLGFKRSALGQPVNKNKQIKIFIIEDDSQQNSSFCTIINGMVSVTNQTINSIIYILKNKVSKKIVITIDTDDIIGENLIKKIFHQYNLRNSLSNLDSDYQFIKKPILGCRKISYIYSNFVINQAASNNLKNQKYQLKHMSLYYTSRTRSNSCQKNLTNLNQTNIQNYPLILLCSYVFIFDAKFLELISPLNFAYYSKYTIQEIIIIPILSILQKSENIFTSESIMHEIDEPLLSVQQFRLFQPKIQNSSICFVSYPNDPFQASQLDLQFYLGGLVSNLHQNISTSLVIYLPYKFGQSKVLFKILKRLFSYSQQNNNSISRIKLRIMGTKAVSSHAVYDAVYYYCPDKALVVSSRHNIKFLSHFSNQILNSVTQSFHYYHTNFMIDGKDIIFFETIPLMYRFLVRRSDLFQKYFRHFQIFKSDFLKTNLFWVLKCAELDFYQTESPFTILMLEEVLMKFQYINKTLVHVWKRKQTQLQKQQIKNVKKYAQYHPLIDNKLMPYNFSCLQNKAYQKNVPEKIQRNIHQIWLGKQKISSLRERLHQTVRDNHPTYEIMLWKFQNITKQNFALTYNLVQRIFQYHKTSEKSFYTLAADLLRYEVIYQHGGIYIDFKMQSLKPMDGFLKYEVFFLDCDISQLRFQSPKVIGVGILGGIKNSYYYKTLLNQFIYQANIDFQKMIPLMSGSYVARRVFNDEQFFTILNLGFQLVYPLPYQMLVNDCGGENKVFDKDQETFSIIDYQTKKKINIGIPCKEYPQAYLVSYEPLSKTWLFEKRNVS